MKSFHYDNPSPYAVVLGIDNDTGLQTARILSQRGIQVIGFAKNSKHWACKTNAIKKKVVVDIEIEKYDLIEALCAFGKKISQKAVLFPCWDETVLMISRHRKVLEPYYQIALPSSEVVEMLMDKASFFRYTKKKNLSIPKTFLFYNREDAEQILEKLPFPCVIKPSIKTKAWIDYYNGHKAHKVLYKKDFLRIYDECSKKAQLLIVQEWIAGTSANLYSCISYFNANSEPVSSFVSRKIRQWFPETGDTCFGEECRNDFVLNESLMIFQELRYHGLGYLEFKKDEKSGKHYLIEANIGRPTGRSALAEDCGVELLYTVYCDKVGWPLPKNIEQKHSGRKWIDLIDDFHSALYYRRLGELTIIEWLNSIRGPKTHAVLSLRDFPSTFAYLLTKCKYLIEKLWQKSTHPVYYNPEQ